MKALSRAVPKMKFPTRVTPSADFFPRMGSRAIIVCGLVLTMFWASLLGYGFLALISSAI